MRLIDADTLERNVMGHDYKNTGLDSDEITDVIYEVIEILSSQPTYNPWREIDDTDGLVEDQFVICMDSKEKDYFERGQYTGGKVCIEEHFADEMWNQRFSNSSWSFAAEKGYTHYMVIPPIQEDK